MQGIISALVTPFTPDGEIDWEAFNLYLDWQLSFQPDIILALGSTGEAHLLSDQEQVEVLRFVVKKAQHKGVKVMVGAGCAATNTTIEKAKCFEQLGADALLIVTPYYVKPSAEGLFAHFTNVASATKVPIVLYNVPSRTGVDLEHKTVLTLFEHENIIGIKEASSDVNRIGHLRKYTDKYIYSGDDVSCSEALDLGADGVISVISNYMPKSMFNMYKTDQRDHWRKKYKGWLEQIGSYGPNPVVIKAL